MPKSNFQQSWFLVIGRIIDLSVLVFQVIYVRIKEVIVSDRSVT